MNSMDGTPSSVSPLRRASSRETAVARHLLSHPGESTYALARHLRFPFSTARDARRRLPGEAEDQLLAHLRRRPVRHEELFFAHPAPEQWLALPPPAPLSISGEDAAALEGHDLVPHRHLFYVAPEDLTILDRSLRDAGAEPVGPAEANITLRVRDPYLLDDPPPLVERGQRLLDYLESRNIQLLRGLGVGP